MSKRIHASVVAWENRGILLHGASGSGKSEVALRLIAEYGAKLIGDDYVFLQDESGVLLATPEPRLTGLIEARGLGILRIVEPAVAQKSCPPPTPLALAVHLMFAPTSPRRPSPRLHDNTQKFKAEGLRIPEISLIGSAVTTPLKIMIALTQRIPDADAIIAVPPTLV